MANTTSRATPGPLPSVERAFGIIHKSALGVAVGSAAALGIIVLTWFHVVVAPASAPDLRLLGVYLYGYDVTFLGSIAGGFWTFIAGFVGGWFLAFTRNFILALLIVFARARSDLDASGDILDHI